MKSKKFTLIDALIILVIIIAAFFVANVMKPSKTKTSGNVEFVIMASSVRNDITEELKKIQPGSEAILSHVEKTNVKIKNVTSKPHENSTYNYETSEYTLAQSNAHSDVYITVSAEADITDKKIQAGDVFIRVGNSASLTSKDISLDGYIVEILSEKEAN